MAGLLQRQAQLQKDFDKIPELAKVPEDAMAKLEKLFQAVDSAMVDASTALQKPDTGMDTRGAETQVIELIGKLLDKSSKSGGGGSGKMSAEQMAMLQQLMKMLGMGAGEGSSAGGNPNGGTTSQASAANDAGNGLTTGTHRVDQSGGHDMAAVPVEFREALEGYYNAVDKLK